MSAFSPASFRLKSEPEMELHPSPFEENAPPLEEALFLSNRQRWNFTDDCAVDVRETAPPNMASFSVKVTSLMEQFSGVVSTTAPPSMKAVFSTNDIPSKSNILVDDVVPEQWENGARIPRGATSGSHSKMDHVSSCIPKASHLYPDFKVRQCPAVRGKEQCACVVCSSFQKAHRSPNIEGSLKPPLWRTEGVGVPDHSHIGVLRTV